jgi:hypothetical protein
VPKARVATTEEVNASADGRSDSAGGLEGADTADPPQDVRAQTAIRMAVRKAV